MELVGLGYTAWFVYRYLLFKVRSDDAVPALPEISIQFEPDMLVFPEA